MKNKSTFYFILVILIVGFSSCMVSQKNGCPSVTKVQKNLKFKNVAIESAEVVSSI